MYEELVKELRDSAEWADRLAILMGRAEGDVHAPVMRKAADTIEKLSALCASQSKDCSEAVAKYLEFWAKQPRWIPVTERLPEPNKKDSRGYAVPYLVMNGWRMVTARRTEDYWVLFTASTVLKTVTHWMPLPEPPKEEK